jgi:hypothetical protein
MLTTFGVDIMPLVNLLIASRILRNSVVLFVGVDAVTFKIAMVGKEAVG